LIAVSVALLAIGSKAQAFTHNFDMFGDYTQYLYSATGVQVVTETIEDRLECRYWQSGTQPGEVTYKYDLPFEVTQASWFGFFEGAAWGGQARILASPDGTNWTVFASGSSGDPPYDRYALSPILQGSSIAFIRAELSPYSQFARTSIGTPILAPNVYEFWAIPEPATACLLPAACAFLGRRKMRPRL
jgi:hypothetical protein